MRTVVNGLAIDTVSDVLVASRVFRETTEPASGTFTVWMMRAGDGTPYSVALRPDGLSMHPAPEALAAILDGDNDG